MKITFLGTGTSTGVPEIGCRCEVCTSTDARDVRLRTSLLVEADGVRILLDCGPDFRQQMLNREFAKLDGVLLSHEHYDHVGGIDDLRPFCRFGDIDIYAEPNVCAALRSRMPYCFGNHLYPGVPRLLLHEVRPDSAFDVGGVEVIPVRLMHGRLPILGYRIGRMAYLTDVSDIPASEFDKLRGLEVLVIDALRYKEHPSHETVGRALKYIRLLVPQRAFLIHMSHHIGLHAEAQVALPENVILSYDGLVVDL